MLNIRQKPTVVPFFWEDQVVVFILNGGVGVDEDNSSGFGTCTVLLLKPVGRWFCNARARERRRLGMPVEACVLEDLVVVDSGAEQVFLSPLSLYYSIYPCILACFGRMMMGLQAQQTVAKQNVSETVGARFTSPQPRNPGSRKYTS
jgi:hypothetical protein